MGFLQWMVATLITFHLQKNGVLHGCRHVIQRWKLEVLHRVTQRFCLKFTALSEIAEPMQHATDSQRVVLFFTVKAQIKYRTD